MTKYKKNLDEIIDNAEIKKKQIIETINSIENQFYKITVYIKNIGITSDSEIQVLIECLEDNIVFNEKDIFQYGVNIYQLIPKLPKLPEKPSIKKDNFMNATVLQRDFNSYIPQIENLNAFRKWSEIEEKNCSVTIKELHVGDKIDLFNKNLILLTENENDIRFKVTIKSKESTRVLYPKPIITRDSNRVALFNSKEN